MAIQNPTLLTVSDHAAAKFAYRVDATLDCDDILAYWYGGEFATADQRSAFGVPYHVKNTTKVATHNGIQFLMIARDLVIVTVRTLDNKMG